MKLASAIFVASLYTIQALGQHATRQDFDDFSKAMKGRWSGQITWITDWPGQGKRGDKVTGYNNVSINEDGNSVFFKSYGGNGSTSSIIVYNAHTKQILELGADSGGSMWSNIWSRKGDKWIANSIGSLADGKKTEGTFTVTPTDNGNTLTTSGYLTIGGKKSDDLHDVFHRVSK